MNKCAGWLSSWKWTARNLHSSTLKDFQCPQGFGKMGCTWKPRSYLTCTDFCMRSSTVVVLIRIDRVLGSRPCLEFNSHGTVIDTFYARINSLNSGQIWTSLVLCLPGSEISNLSTVHRSATFQTTFRTRTHRRVFILCSDFWEDVFKEKTINRGNIVTNERWIFRINYSHRISKLNSFSFSFHFDFGCFSQQFVFPVSFFFIFVL